MSFETKLRLNKLTGDDLNDGITARVFSTARISEIIDADPDNFGKYTVVIETTLHNEPLVLPRFNVTTSTQWIKVIFINGAQSIGDGVTANTAAVVNPHNSGMWIVGLKCSGYQYAISEGPLENFSGQYTTPSTIIEDCDLDGYIYIPRTLKVKILNSIIHTGIARSSNGIVASFTLNWCENVNFNGASFFEDLTANYLNPTWTPASIVFGFGFALQEFNNYLHYLGNSSFEDCGDITFFLNVGQNYGTSENGSSEDFLKHNNWTDSKVNFTNDFANIPATWVEATDAATMRAKALTDGVTLSDDWFTEELFAALTLDTFGYQASENDYIKNAHVGATRYATSESVSETRSSATAERFTIPLTTITTGGRLVNKGILHKSETDPTLDEVVSDIRLQLTKDGENIYKTVPIESGIQEIGGKNYFEIVEVLTDSTLGKIAADAAFWPDLKALTTGTASTGIASFQWKSYLNISYFIERGVLSIESGLTVQAGSVLKFIMSDISTCYDVVLVQLTRTTAGVTNSADFGNFGSVAFSEEISFDESTNTIEIRLNQAAADYINSGGVDFGLMSADDFNDSAPALADNIGDTNWFDLSFQYGTQDTELLKIDKTSISSSDSVNIDYVKNAVPFFEDATPFATKPLVGEYGIKTISGSYLEITAISNSTKKFTIFAAVYIPTTWAATSDIWMAISGGNIFFRLEESSGILRLECRLYQAIGGNTVVRGNTYTQVEAQAEFAGKLNYFACTFDVENNEIILYENDTVYSRTLNSQQFDIEGGELLSVFTATTEDNIEISQLYMINEVLTPNQVYALQDGFTDYQEIDEFTAEGVNVEVIVTGADFGNVTLDGFTSEKQTINDQIEGVRELKEQQGNSLIELPYSFKRPEKLKDYFSVPSKEYYTFQEIITESQVVGSNIEITYADDPDNTQIEFILVQTETKQVKVKTFGA